jgi:catalase
MPFESIRMMWGDAFGLPSPADHSSIVICFGEAAGERNLLDEDAVLVGGRNHSHATADLFEAIAKGDYPEWQLCIQTMNVADEGRFDFDPLDVTKTWPEDLFPLQPVGRMVRLLPLLHEKAGVL